MYEYYQAEKEKRKNMTKDQKEAAKEEKLALDEMYGTCYLDGRKEKVGNYRIEPPGLFRGRGKHPKTGCLKVYLQVVFTAWDSCDDCRVSTKTLRPSLIK